MMNPTCDSGRARAVALLLPLLASALVAQTVPSASPAAEDDAVKLTPFAVSSDRDAGFAAASSLAGGRLASDLRDTPAAFSVINREFIDALNLTDLQSAANWATGSTFQSDIGTFNFTTFTVRYNTRGVSAGQQLRNFFLIEVAVYHLVCGCPNRSKKEQHLLVFNQAACGLHGFDRAVAVVQ